jgi:DNA-directed RNA polymerase specialized sigma24 family protein
MADNTQAQFSQTHWTVVLSAANQQSPDATSALEELCGKYWYPLYAFLRRQGRSPEDAKDLTQGFFAHLLVKDRLQHVHPTKGKFRSFLLACLNNYVQNERDRQQAGKRGGGQPTISIDALAAEDQYRFEPVEVKDPAKIYERRWAAKLIEQVLQQLKESCVQDGKAESFEALLPFLVGEAERGDYAPAAARLGKNEGAVRAEATRLRAAFLDLLRAEVGRTVSSPEEVDDEIRHLFSASR